MVFTTTKMNFNPDKCVKNKALASRGTNFSNVQKRHCPCGVCEECVMMLEFEDKYSKPK